MNLSVELPRGVVLVAIGAFLVVATRPKVEGSDGALHEAPTGPPGRRAGKAKRRK